MAPRPAHWKTMFGYLLAAGLHVVYVLVFDLCVCVLCNSLTVIALSRASHLSHLFFLWTYSCFSYSLSVCALCIWRLKGI